MKLFKHFFVDGRPCAAAHELSIEAAQEIVQQYANFVESSSPLPGRVADAGLLPHSKETIKNALATCICAARNTELTDHLKQGYLMLSAWQNDVGEKMPGLDLTRIDLDADPLEIAEIIQNQSATMRPWEPLIKAEQEQLGSELKALGA